MTTWHTLRLGALYDVRDERAAGAADALPLLSVSQTYGVIPRAELAGDTGRAESLRSYKICEPGDIVLNRMSAYNGAVGIARERGIVSPDYLVMQPRPAVCPDFVAGWLRTPRGVYEMTLRLRGIGSADSAQVRTPRVNESDLRLIPIALPPVELQQAIVGYLDLETARIDRLIQEQQRLVEMLRERRRAVLAHALSVAAPEVPFLRCMTEQVDYRGATPIKTESGVRLVTARNVKAGWIDYQTSQEFVDAKDYATIMRRGLPRVGDLLFTMEAPLGNIAVVDREEIALAQRVIKWSVNRAIAEPRFLMYAALGEYFQDQLRARATGSTALGIKASKLPELRIGLPSLDEQREIVAYLDAQTTKIDTLITETERFIELARERRSALITAAVTGQIVVRQEAA